MVKRPFTYSKTDLTRAKYKDLRHEILLNYYNYVAENLKYATLKVYLTYLKS